MTLLWRCCKRKRLDEAFTGKGGLYHGSRWHSAGKPIIYTSDHASLALVETLVHSWPLEHVLRTHVLISCEFPEDQILMVPEEELPDDWNAVQPAAETQKWGDRWLAQKKHAAIRVPSAVLPGDNVLINPLHPRVDDMLRISEKHLEWDPRLVEASA